jgi:hypothetical protein
LNEGVSNPHSNSESFEKIESILTSLKNSPRKDIKLNSESKQSITYQPLESPYEANKSLLYNHKNKQVLNNKQFDALSKNESNTRAADIANAFFQREVSFGKDEI